MTLATNIRILTKPHPAYNNQGQLGTAQPLLTQLSSTNTAAHKNTTSNETPLPISIKAIALWQDLHHQAQDIQHQRGQPTNGGLHHITSSWENITGPWQPILHETTTDWIARITNTIDPPRARRPLRQACASCGQRWTTNHDGQRTEAVTAWVWDDNGAIANIDNWEVTCTNCNAQWVGLEVGKTYWRATA